MKSHLATFVMVLGVVVAFGLIAACDGRVNVEKGFMIQRELVSGGEWRVLLKRHVVFGHQSVGNNILSGVRTLAGQAGVNLPVTESRISGTGHGITHFKIGRNTDPLSKIKDFAAAMEGGAAPGADIALIKLCYIDFDGRTDVKSVADEYSSSLDRLSRQFPGITFVAVTTPLTTIQGGPKAWVKQLLRRAPSGYAENAQRQEFNDYLRARYVRQGRLFDLARIEAGGAPGCQFQGRPGEMLNPALTYDGGHLNSQGEQVVAAKFLKFIAALSLSPEKR